MAPIYGSVEAGGTKFVCAVAEDPDNILEEIRFPTESTERTLYRALKFFRRGIELHGPLAALGIGAFGPLDPDPTSSTYGYITTTPKPGWAMTDVAGYFTRELKIPVGFDTDTNAAALGEGRWGAGRSLTDFVYVTVGTGIGGGVMVNGDLIHGLVHPELGHFSVVPDPDDDFSGACPFHGTCLEGMASGPAIEKRWGKRAEELPTDHPAWSLEAEYLAQGCAAFCLNYSPKRIILGGGVMHQRQLFPLIREKTLEKLNGYVGHPAVLEKMDSYIVPPDLGDNAGLAGALILAERAYKKR